MTEPMRSGPSALRARIGNRLAQYFGAAPHRLPADRPMVSFTFDDAPDSAASVGAPVVEDHGGCATFYIAGGLINRWSGDWNGIGESDVVALHGRGHEIACHTFSHPRVNELGAAALTAEIEANRRALQALDATIRLENFAYPYGLASVAHKKLLKNTFRSSRGIVPGVNHGVIDLQFLRATPLVCAHIDHGGIDRAFDEARATGGWLIFYSHDVTGSPSPYGCTPALLRHALEAASQRRIPILTVAQALQRAGVSMN